jgi:hypothetical protein
LDKIKKKKKRILIVKGPSVEAKEYCPGDIYTLRSRREVLGGIAVLFKKVK